MVICCSRVQIGFAYVVLLCYTTYAFSHRKLNASRRICFNHPHRVINGVCTEEAYKSAPCLVAISQLDVVSDLMNKY